MIVTMQDVRASKGCSRGARLFFEQNNLDWQDFLKNGIDDSILYETGDAMAIQIAEEARGRKEQT